MSHNVASDPRDSGTEISVSRSHATGAKVKTVYYDYRESSAPVGEECTGTVNGEPLDGRYDLLSASLSGFEWGYCGSGPAQLAIAILAYALDDDAACDLYQRFKREIVADLPDDRWRLTAREIKEWRSEITLEMDGGDE